MYQIELSPSAVEDLKSLKRFEQRFVLDSIEQHLSFEPTNLTRNRKPLRQNEISEWELRLGDFRVFYDVDESRLAVRVKAVGRKEHNRLLIRGKEFDL